MDIKGLRDDLVNIYKELREGKIGLSEAKELSNVSGKIVSTAKTQMEYNKMTGNNNGKIAFLESPE
jgi:hypothetical protein